MYARLGHQRTGKRKKDANERRRKKALKYFQEALHFRQSHYGEHVVTAFAHKDLAGHYLAKEDFCKAEENYEAAVRIFEGIVMMKQKEEIFRPTKTLEDIMKRVARLTPLEEYSRWEEKSLMPLSKEITNGRLRSTPI